MGPYLKNKNRSQTPKNDEPKTKQLEPKETDTVVEEVQQIEEIHNATQKDKHSLWEVFRTLLLSISSGVIIFVTQIAAIECFIVIYFFQKKFLATDTVVEEVQQIEEIHNARQEYKYPPWEVLTTILLSMISVFVIFLKRISSKKIIQ